MKPAAADVFTARVAMGENIGVVSAGFSLSLDHGRLIR
jgi:hypothetical protein